MAVPRGRCEFGVELYADEPRMGVTTLAIWGGEAFGPLVGWGAMRLSIASVTAMILGFQIAFGAFFITVLGMLRAEPGAG